MEKQQAHEYKMRKLELDHELEMAKVQANKDVRISADNHAQLLAHHAAQRFDGLVLLALTQSRR